MHEIKYRGYDYRAGKMFYNIHELYDGYGNITDREGNELDIYESTGCNVSSFFTWIEEPGFKVMQYTGLNDKDKKEIYDGDIIETASGRYKVFWFEPFASFRLRNVPQTNECLANYDDMKIIGNIYENPDLL